MLHSPASRGWGELLGFADLRCTTCSEHSVSSCCPQFTSRRLMDRHGVLTPMAQEKEKARSNLRFLYLWRVWMKCDNCYTQWGIALLHIGFYSMSEIVPALLDIIQHSTAGSLYIVSLLFFFLFTFFFLLKPILILERTWDTRTISETYGHPKDWPTPSICPTTPSVGASSVGRLQLIYRESPIQPYRKKTYREAFLFGVQLNLRYFSSLSVSFSPELTMLSENPTSNKVTRKMLTRASGAASVGTEQETREWTWRNAVKS